MASMRMRPVSAAGCGVRLGFPPIRPVPGSVSKARYPAAARAGVRPSILACRTAHAAVGGSASTTIAAGPRWVQRPNVCTSSQPPASRTASWVAVYGPNGSVTPWIFPTTHGMRRARV